MARKQSVTEPFLTTAEMAGVLRVHPKTLNRWVDDGAPCYRAPEDNSALRFRQSEVESWMKRRKPK